MRAFSVFRIFAVLSVLLFIGVTGSACAQDVQVTRKTVSIPVTRQDEAGIFHVKGKINSVEVDFIVDTGASQMGISMATAYALGLQHKEPVEITLGMTANGIIRVPIFLLEEVTIGDITIRNLRAGVMPGRADVNMLGNNFLLKLNRFEYKDGVLTLEQ